MGPAPWAQQLLTLLAPHLVTPPGDQEEQEPPTQVHPSHTKPRLPGDRSSCLQDKEQEQKMWRKDEGMNLETNSSKI